MTDSATKDGKKMLAAGKPLEEVLAFLRGKGASKVDCIKVLVEAKGMSLREAKETIHFSRVWDDVRERDNALHQKLAEVGGAEEIQETVIRRLNLRRTPKSVPIHLNAGEPINPDWVAIVHAQTCHPERESFNLSFFLFNGELITWEQFETLEIALDQASAIAGIGKAEWEMCQVKVVSDEGRVP